MERIITIKHRDKKIILLDFSYIEPGTEFYDLVEKGMSVVQACAPGTALTLVDVTNSEYDIDMVEALVNLASWDKPYVRASAVVGATGMLEMAKEVVVKWSEREFKAFETREAALDWLVKQ